MNNSRIFLNSMRWQQKCTRFERSKLEISAHFHFAARFNTGRHRVVVIKFSCCNVNSFCTVDFSCQHFYFEKQLLSQQGAKKKRFVNNLHTEVSWEMKKIPARSLAIPIIVTGAAPLMIIRGKGRRGWGPKMRKRENEVALSAT